MTAASATVTVEHDPTPSKLPIERRCIIWVHNEGDFKDEVVLNLDLFPDVKPGELMAIVALTSDSGVRDFQDRVQAHKKESDSLGTAINPERSNSNTTSSNQVNGLDVLHDVDLGKRYLFLAKDMPIEIKLKQPNLEVSIAKHIADVFGLKHRSNVILTTVRLL